MYQSLDQELNIFIPPPQKFRNGFENTKYRLVFVRKVYGLLTFQLLLTSIFLFFSVKKPLHTFLSVQSDISDYALPNILALICLTLIIFISIFVYKFQSVSRRSPVNLVCFLLFTFSAIYLTAYIFVDHPNNTKLTVALTNTLTLFLQLYAKKSSRFSIKKAALILVIWVILALGGLSLWIHYKHTAYNFVTVGFIVLGICLYGTYLLYHIYRVTETSKYQLSPENHLTGNLLTYIDIMVIFCKFFRICGGRD